MKPTRSYDFRRYEPPRDRVLAIEPSAFMAMFVVAHTRANEEIDGVSVVDVFGPLEQGPAAWCDTYDAIVARFAEACESQTTRAIVLRIDSPGGDCGGCFDAARALRKLATDARKPFVAYVTGKACSAGYALASAAESIVMSDTAYVGSIGVLSQRADFTAQNAAHGVRVEFVTSGSSKADGHPDSPMTDAERKRTQTLVDSLAASFFELVAEMRHVSADDVRALDAQVFHGRAAIEARLADEIAPFGELLARAAGATFNPAETTMSAYEKAVAALEEAASGEDANAAAAKKALAILQQAHGDGDGSDKPADGDKPADAVDDDADKPAADSDADKPAAADSDADKPAAADDDADKPKAGSAMDIALKAMAEVHKMKAAAARDVERSERKTLLDGRPDFDAAMRTLLETAPMKTVREFCAKLPRGVTPKSKLGAPPVAGTRGAGQQSSPSAALPSHEEISDPSREMTSGELDRRMGLHSTTMRARRVGNAMTFGVVDEPLKPRADKPA